MATTVTPRELRNAAGEIETLLGTYTTKINGAYNVVDTIKGIWDSDASRQFQTKMETDRAAYDSLKTLLTEYGLSLTKSAADYEEAERRAKEALEQKQ